MSAFQGKLPAVVFSGGVIVGLVVAHCFSGVSPEDASDGVQKLPANLTLASGMQFIKDPAVKSTLSELFGDQFCDFLGSDRFPEREIDKLKVRLESGQISREESSVLLLLAAKKWPEETMRFIAAIDPKVSNALRLEAVGLRGVAGLHPEFAIDYILERDADHFNPQELYDIGLAMQSGNSNARELFSRLPEGVAAKLDVSTTEAVLRREGVSGMIASVAARKGSTVTHYDSEGKVTGQSSGPTYFAIQEMARLFGETSSVSTDDFIRSLEKAEWWGEPFEVYAAMKEIARLDTAQAFKIAERMKGEAGDNAIEGAFMTASENNSEKALRYLETVTDLKKQNELMGILRQKTSDDEVRRECEEIMNARGWRYQ